MIETYFTIKSKEQMLSTGLSIYEVQYLFICKNWNKDTSIIEDNKGNIFTWETFTLNNPL